MTLNKPSAFVLVGPTASGKSAVAQILAERTGTAIVSADSMNIYCGMDIGTAKPSPEERARVKTFGIDLADPTEPFSVGDWLNAVRPAFQSSETPPIVAGGTGLYVKCLLQGLDDLPTADVALRERTEKMTLAELQAEARTAAPEAYEALADKENPRRLIRLLEGKKTSESWKSEMPTVIGLHVERDDLHRRIAERVGKMYAGGLLEEARGLMELKLSSTAQHAIGYAEAFAVLRGEMAVAEAKEKTVIRTRQLSKRQMTWFRHQLNVEWVKTADYPDEKSLADKVAGVWEKGGAVPVKGV
ncbi:MAG: tRNA (adenosine(37)-N6)-dimethylallyltransferase MiaA [Kiritimatiellaceae bacterium]|nr:tRNA (adenosine(37)-N6)-dimethylallyltransferase MiaA [Kiritimatiellaceae bacterium]